jgi:regulatory protein
MKITSISVQARNPDRVNVSVDGSYRFSLDILQVTDLGIKIGNDYSEEELAELEQESVFGKLYARALEYTMMRPHSAKEVRDYLWRKTRDTMVKSRRTGEVMRREGVSTRITDRVYERLVEKGYVDDEKFAKYWVENRSLGKGVSARKLTAELRAKGVEQGIISSSLSSSDRADNDELKKVIAKKHARYPDEQKFKQYLLRQGFSYDDINDALSDLAQPGQADERD